MPSWSWASISGPVLHEPIQESFLILHGHIIRLNSVDLTGGVEYGILDLSCPVFTARRNEGFRSESIRLFDDSVEHIVQMHFDVPTEKDAGISHRLAVVGVNLYQTHGSYNTVQVQGIVIVPLPRRKLPGTVQCKRIGLWKIRIQESTQHPHDWKQLHQSMERFQLV